MNNYKTLTELFISRKNEEQKGITFILSDTNEKYISYKELYYTSLKLLYHFQKSGYKRGDEVIFQIDDNERFIYSFWACILGGMIPVPITTGSNDEHKMKLFKICDILNNPKIIATAEFFEKLCVYAEKNNISDKIESLKRSAIFLEEVIQTEKDGEIYTSQSNNIAFIQFSSGSTGDPKGVIITHDNVLVDLNAVLQWDQIGPNDIGLNWMPLTHDMGLIGTHIKGILACMNQYNINTALFIRHPSLWIQKASEHKATILYSPNFGYKHFLKFYHADDKKNWDLSSIRLIYNGAEPISLDLCNEFLDSMSVYGLKRNAMHPVYGLAEGTIAVAFPKTGEDLSFHVLNRNHLKVGETIVETSKEDKDAVIFVDEGYPIYNCYARICDEENQDIGENKIGYVQISGGNVTSGYYNNKKATEQTITADGWLNTGDLGFIKEKRLTITGRAKDVIFASGQNYYSHDIERIGEGVEGIELGKIVAVGAFNENRKGDDLILFVIHKQKLENFIPIVNSLKRVINEKIGIEVAHVIQVKNIPKTTSGKVQRYKLRDSFMRGEFELVKHEIERLLLENFEKREYIQPNSNTEKELAQIWSDVLNIKQVGIRDDFFALGGNSLHITQTISRIRDSFGIELEQGEIFESPDIEQLAKKLELYNKNQQGRFELIKRTSVGKNRLPLSFAQQRLWFLDGLNSESPQYNLYTGLVLKGSLKKEVLIKSFNALIRRHQVLQVSFTEENGQPVQVLNNDAKMSMEYVNLLDTSANEKLLKASDIAKECVSKPFVLEKAPLLRGMLIEMEEEEHLLVLAIHHIIFDGWSFGILLKELNFYYEAFLNDKKDRLSLEELPLPDIQYADYAQWQIEKLKEGSLKKQIEYWKQKLSGKLPVLDLPLDNQRPPVQTYKGAKFTCTISEELVNKLQLYAGKEKATLFMVLLAAFKLMLYRYSGQLDIVVGSPIANRNRKDIEGLIGFFTNNIVLRTTFSSDINFNEFLRLIKNVTLEAYENQDVPFEKLVEELHTERDMSRNPLFQVLFGLQNLSLPHMEFSELSVSTKDLDAGYARFDLAVDVRESGGSLLVDFEYNTELFNEDTIMRMAGHYKQLLTNILKNPEAKLDNFEMLTIEEKDTLINIWNDTKEDYADKVQSLVELFTEQAKETPKALAVVCDKQHLTYQELEIESNRLANYLISNGVGAECIVGIYMERSVNMLVGLLGTHKAGGAYLPMDPVFPRERIAFMLEDAKVNIILSESMLAETLPQNAAKVICLDSEKDTIAKYSSDKPSRNYEGHYLAYLIYTSGSTGNPKGVQIEQRALINFLLSMEIKTGICEKDALLAVTTLSFDIAGLEMYLPLICGAKVVIAKRDEVTDGSALMEIINQQNITIMQATPATWKLLIEAGWKGNKDLTVLCGGEALPRDLANQLLDRCKTLLNVYGPTETTIWSTLDCIDSKAGEIFIGKPIANTQVYVVDRAMNPVPVRIPGELLIGGDGLARGYLNLPELTREKFIKDNFSGNKGARLYRTGDLVRFTRDGNIEFVGRIDNQVKIRGFRIELGEIETLLNLNPSIKDCVVDAKEVIAGEKTLIAYIIPVSEQTEEDLSFENLRKSLKEKLPNYMIPSSFMFIKSFPMTPNGKIDRKALPLPENIRPQLSTQYTAPSDKLEELITRIWQEVLHLERIGVNDNFFDMGGHSLLLAQVRSKISNVLHKEVSIMDLFRYPTISTLSRFLQTGKNPKLGETYKQVTSFDKKDTDVAIIGLSGRFPGAANLQEFWDNLCNGVECISRFTDEQVLEEGVDPELLKKPDYVKAWGVLNDVDKFDANFFGYNPREAEVLDPQQRIFLEECWKAFETAGYDSERYQGKIGVYASVGMNHYMQNIKDSRGSQGLASDYQIMTSNDKDFLATRIAYKMNLEGPALTVQTACSSSLVAVHLACQSLFNGECDMALAGGVSIRLPQKSGYLYQEGMILSPDGHCRAFDEQAKGTIGGNGTGVVVLKRLQDAIADGDDISAVIKGTAINNDGALKIGYTAPRIDGQAKVIEEAQLNAGVEPETITYIEAHGTGTPLGDPIEIEALTQVFNQRTDQKGFCAIGSVKTNIGHLDAASGVTGLIKTVLSLRNKKIPQSLNFKSPNPKINFNGSPFYVNEFLTEWKNSNGPLRAGVSSFGIGGTNAHAVLEEAPEVYSDKNNHSEVLLVFSAKSNKALDRMTANFVDFLKANKEINLADVAYTLQMGRREFEFRRFVVGTSVENALQLLEKNINEAKATDAGALTIDEPAKYSLEQLGNLWIVGNKVNWSKLYKGEKRKRVALPNYPFDGQSYWVKKDKTVDAVKDLKSQAQRAELSEWFYTPVWKQSVKNGDYSIAKEGTGKEVLLVLLDKNIFTHAFIKRLTEEYTDTYVALSAEQFTKTGSNQYTINIDDSKDYERLLRELSEMGKTPTKVINLLGLLENTSIGSLEQNLQCGRSLFYSMMFLAQAIGRCGITTPVQIKVITNNSQRVFNERPIYPEKALHLGACRVIPREYPNIKCSSIDCILPEADSLEEQEDLTEQLIAEITTQTEEGIVAYRGLSRWTQEFEKMELVKANNSPIKIKEKGVYLITGGLGGIGLVLAEYLAREAKAKLVLVGRSEFPDVEQWEQWITTNHKKDTISRKINKLKQLLAMGSEIYVCQADVANLEQVGSLREKIINKYGTIDGVIHAAGSPGGGMIQLKKKEQAEQVLLPKVQGAQFLYRAMKEDNLDFMIFCSSLNAITGGFGQVDYSAANAFLDAFAHSYDSKRGTRLVSINWDRWPGVGMAAGNGMGTASEEEIHPLIGKCILEQPEKVIYSQELSPEKNWVLSEHLVLGVPTIAGTTYLEMARAAFEDTTGETNVQISDVLFLNPMAVRIGEKRKAYTLLNKNGEAYDFRIISQESGAQEDKGNWLEHARGKISCFSSLESKTFKIWELKEKCSEKTVYSSEEQQKLSEEFISFGNRWRNLKRFSHGETEGFVELGLAEDYVSDLNSYKIHPAMLDMATGAVRLVAGGNYLPFSYEKIEIKEPMPEKIYSYIRFKNGYNSSQEIITCDIDILGEKGNRIIGIINFSMKLIDETAAANIKSRNQAGLQQGDEVAFIRKLVEQRLGSKTGILNEGILPTEGQEAFGHILHGCFTPQIIVSTKGIMVAIEQANYFEQAGIKNTVEDTEASKERHPRPELENEYVRPKNDTERKLAELWQEVLGIDKVGIQDDFFALGGDSLLLIQFHTKLKERFETDVAVVDLYKYNTVASLAGYLNNDNKEELQPVFEEVNSRVNKQLELMKQRRQHHNKKRGGI